MPDRIESSALNEWLFNEDTIRKALALLMEKGLKIDYGEKLGKTILFAKNHRHAEKILAVFNKEYPHLPGYAKVIDNYMTYAQSAIDEFSDPQKLPQIAISVDMLETGIDVPEVLNLVFFKKVMSKAKFWQMIGRGTRLCPALMDGKDKDKFYIFDLCGNFEFFRMKKDKAVPGQMALQSAIFYLKAQIIYKLQDLAYQTADLIPFRQKLVDEMLAKVQELDWDHFAVRQHLRYVEKFSDPKSYAALSYEDTLYLRDEVAPLLLPDQDVFNVLYGHRTLQIDDAIFNYDVRFFSAYLLKSDGQHTMNWVMRNTVFLHFCGRHKPWKNMCLSRFSALYQHYMNLAQKAETNKPHTVGYEKG